MVEFRVVEENEPFTLHWDNGVVTGDAYAVLVVEIELEFDPAVSAAGGPHWEGKDEILNHAGAFYLLLKTLFPTVEVVTGKLPPLPATPSPIN